MDMYGGYFHEICLYETFLKGKMYMKHQHMEQNCETAKPITVKP